MKFRITLAMALISLLCVFACSKDDDADLLHIGVVSLTMEKPTLSLVAGSSETLIATILPKEATNKAVSWTSSNNDVATVSEAGLVTALKEGTATITCTSKDGGKTTTCEITVTKAVVAVAGVMLSKNEISLPERTSETLVATIAPENATNKEVTWSTSDAAIVTVNNAGLITAVKEGAATITCTTNDGGKTSTCKVTVTKAAVAVTSVILNKNVLSLVEEGTETLTATIAPENATNKEVTWASSNPAVATVSDAGVVTAVKAGSATITCTTKDGEKTATCTVSVTASAVAVTGVSLSKTELSLAEAGTETLTATVAPENATNKSVTWSSSDPAVASVSDAGVVTALKAGSATITCTSNDGGHAATCKVTVTKAAVAVTGVSLSKTELSLTEAATETLTATVAPENATNKEVTWSTSDAAIATVSDAGVVTAVKAGSATITCTTKDGNKTATCAVTVTANTVAVTGVTLNKPTLSLAESATETLTATIAPENATNKEVTWSTSDAAIATVSEAGVVTAVKAGSATITCTTKDGNITATCAVTVTASTVAVTGIRLTREPFTMPAGIRMSIKGFVIPADATNQDVTWSTSNAQVATVTQTDYRSCTIAGVSAGTATITCTSADGGITNSILVTITDDTPITAITLDKTELDLITGQSEKLTASVTPSNASTKNLIWKSDYPDVVSVTQDGVVTVLTTRLNRVRIRCSTGYSPYAAAECYVTTGPVLVNEIVFYGADNVQLGVGDTYELAPRVFPHSAENKALSWSSSNPSILSITKAADDRAVVTAVGVGKATITCTAKDGSGVTQTVDIEVLGDKIPVSSITSAKNKYVLGVSEEVQLETTILPSNAFNKNLDWLSSDRNIVSVNSVSGDNSKAVAAALKMGTVTITATARDGSGVKATFTITVRDPGTGGGTIGGWE